MNRSLLARTRPEFYTEAIKIARECGASEEEITEQMNDDIRIARLLLEGKCPTCGAPIARYVDREQQGPSSMPGVWVMYRCSTAPAPGRPRGSACDFMIDLVEGDEAN